MCLIRARNYRWMPSLRGSTLRSKPPQLPRSRRVRQRLLLRRRRRARMAALEVRTFLMWCSIPLGRRLLPFPA